MCKIIMKISRNKSSQKMRRINWTKLPNNLKFKRIRRIKKRRNNRKRLRFKPSLRFNVAIRKLKLLWRRKVKRYKKLPSKYKN